MIRHDQRDDRDRHHAEHRRVVLEEPEQGARVLAEDNPHEAPDDVDGLARDEVARDDRLGDLVGDDDREGERAEDRPSAAHGARPDRGHVGRAGRAGQPALDGRPPAVVGHDAPPPIRRRAIRAGPAASSIDPFVTSGPAGAGAR